MTRTDSANTLKSTNPLVSVLRWILHIIHFGYVVGIFVVTCLPEEKLFDLAFQYIYDLGDFKYYTGAFTLVYFGLLALFIHQNSQTKAARRATLAKEQELVELKSKVYDMMKRSQEIEAEMKQVRESLPPSSSDSAQ